MQEAEEESLGKTIFKAHQDALAQWTSFVVDHELGLEALLTQPPTRSVSSSPLKTTVFLMQTRRKSEDALDLFAPPPREQGEVDEMQRRSLIALCFVLSEIDTLSRRIQDEEEALFSGSTLNQIAQRMLALIQNLHLQLLASARKEEEKEPRPAIIWRLMARAIASLVVLETRHKLVLLRPGLAFLEQTYASSSAAAVALLLMDSLGRTLKLWMQSAFTSWHVLDCVCLFIYLVRLGSCASSSQQTLLKERDRTDWLKRFEELFSRVSPNLPVVRQRRCIRAEDLLYAHCAGVKPSVEHFAKLRMAYTKTFMGNFRTQCLKLAQEAVFATNKLEVAQRISHLVFNCLHTHLLCKLALPKDVLPSLLLCLDTLVELASKTNAPRYYERPAALAKRDIFGLVPPSFTTNAGVSSTISSTSRAVAINLFFALADNDLCYSEADYLALYARACSVRLLFQAFNELCDPLLQLVLQGAIHGARFYGLTEAFPETNVWQMVAKQVCAQVDNIVRTRLVMRLSETTDLLGLEQKRCEVQTLLAAMPIAARREVEYNLGNAWQTMRTTGIDRTASYFELQRSALEYFGLDIFLDVNLCGTPGGGFDLMAQPREESFYSRFKYNLDFACLVERKRALGNNIGNKHEQYISVSVIKQSLDSLGAGAISTVVNTVYLFLAQRFSKLSLLLQQVKRYRKSARAFKFFKFELAMEQCAESKPVWSELCVLLGEIGIGFGLVRNLGLAAMQQQQQEESMVEDYVNVLIRVFAASQLKDQLGGFFLLAPALCVEFVDSSLRAREVGKPSQLGEALANSSNDDGFAMGLSALLAILKQESLFDSIKFFAGVVQYFATNSAGKSAAATVDPSAATFQMRHRGLAREYELLMYSLASARIVFKP